MTDESQRPPGVDGTGVRLTRRERNILRVSARGAGVLHVAGELGLAEQEVRTALASAIGKLGARSKLEAVLVALRRGLVDLSS
jgi:DNA-binding NarL/FixJ family response regulator